MVMITGREKIEPIRVTGIISNETYDWAIEAVQSVVSATMPVYDPPYMEHARWIIDRVKDGTLEIAHD